MAEGRQPIKAHVTIEYDDGSVYSMDIEAHRECQMTAVFEWSAEPIEDAPSADGWAQYRAGLPIGHIELRGWARRAGRTQT